MYVSRYHGRDLPTCGSTQSPCKTVMRGVEIAGWNDRIWLDGTVTTSDPYTCEPTKQEKQAITGIVNVSKSLQFVAFSSSAHFRCGNSLRFISPTFAKKEMKVSFTGLVFSNTTMSFADSSVFIANCSFLNSAQPIHVKVARQQTVAVAVRNSRFVNNKGCVRLELSKSAAQVAIDMSGTIFQRNRPIKQFEGSGVSFQSQSHTSPDVAINISCKHILFLDNEGPLITNNVASSLTSEHYQHVKFLRNSGWYKSLYLSKARKSVILFDNLVSARNGPNARCLRLNSSQASVDIVNSQVSDHRLIDDSGSGIFVEVVESMQALIKNTSFQTNIGTSGGAVLFYTEGGHVDLKVLQSDFTQNKAFSKNGGAISVTSKKGFVTLDIENTHFTSCAANRYGGAIYVFFYNASSFAARNSTWMVNRATTGAAITLSSSSDNAQSKLTANVSSCRFVSNYDRVTSGIFLVTVSVGWLEFFRIQWIKNSNCFYLNCDCTVNFKEVNVSSSSSTAIYMGSGIYRWRNVTTIGNANMKVRFQRCVMHSNRGDHIIVDTKSPYVSLTLDDVQVDGQRMDKTGGKNVLRVNLRKEVIYGSKITLHKVMVVNAIGAAAVLIRLKSYNNTITMKDCSFRDIRSWYSRSYRSSVSPLSVVMPEDERKLERCLKSYLTYEYRNTLIIENTSFQGNIGRISGGLYLRNGNTTLRNCRFLDNFAIYNGGHIYVSDSSGTLRIENSSFKQHNVEIQYQNETFSHSTSIYSDSVGAVILRNTLLTTDQSCDFSRLFSASKAGPIRFDDSTKVQCSVGSSLRFDNFSHSNVFWSAKNNSCNLKTTVITISCHRCAQGLYSLARGEMLGLRKENTSRSFCAQCPYGANCSHSIKAKPNFWGYLVTTNPPRLKFVSCPPDYCRTADSNPTNLSMYNGCCGNRHGFMCGKCKEGFTETLISKNCKSARNCKDYWVWLVMAVYAVFMALFLIHEPPLIEVLVSNILWFTRRKGYQDLDRQDSDNKGYTNILFYFYQAASYLAIEPFSDLVKKARLVKFFTEIFNFRTGMPAGLGCPFPGLNVVTKELFLSMNVFATLFSVLAMFGLHWVFNKARGKSPPEPAYYAAASIKTLLLGYATLANTALKLLSCVPVLGDWRLYYDGNIKCLTWWQQLLIVYMMAVLVPFIAVLSWGAMKLRNNIISARHFIAACSFPLGFVCFWLLQKIYQTTSQQKREELTNATRLAILKVVLAPFTSLYWQSVLMGRRFLLLSFQVLFPDPMVRLFSMDITCLAILIWHMASKPFRDWKANIVETASLAVLVVIATINLVQAVFLSAGVTPQGPVKRYLRALERIEISLLGIVPLLAALLCTFAILSQLVRIIVLCFRWLAVVCRRIFGFFILRWLEAQRQY